MGAAMGRAAMLGMAGTAAGLRETTCVQDACEEADCVAVQNRHTLNDCTLTDNGQCVCLNMAGSLSNVTCHYCVIGDFTSCYVVRAHSIKS